MRLAPSAERGK